MRLRRIGLVLAVAVAVAAVALVTLPNWGGGTPAQAVDPDTTGAALWAHLQQAKYEEN